MEYSAPANTASGRYYWTNAYYWESDFSTPPSDPSNNRVHLAQINSVSEGVTIERWRVESAFDTGTYLADIPGGFNGNLSGADRVLLIDAARLQSGSGTRGGWYKPLRGLLRAGDVGGGLLSDEIVEWLGLYVVPLLALVPLVNCRRQPVGDIRISRLVHPWQMRHGTKRSARRVLLPR